MEGRGRAARDKVRRSAVKVRLVRTGGVAGLRVTTELDSADLSAEESLRLAKLVEDAPWSGLPTRTMARPKARDLMEYAITVEGDTVPRAMVGDDLTLPGQARELVAFVIERGRHSRGARR